MKSDKTVSVLVRIPVRTYVKLEEMLEDSTHLSVPELIRRILDDYFKSSSSSCQSEEEKLVEGIGREK